MTDDTDPVADGLRRALEAAELANDAAEDVSRLGQTYQAFSDRTIAAQKRNTALASGALAGALVALGLASLVYFRSVADLHEAAELQAEAAKLVIEQVLVMKDINAGAEDRGKQLEARIEGIAKGIADTMAQAQAAEPAQDPTKPLIAEIAASEERLLAALAEVDLNATDNPALVEALARIEAGLLRASAAPANPAASPTGGSQPPKGAAAPKPAANVSPRPVAAPEPNPFAYP